MDILKTNTQPLVNDLSHFRYFYAIAKNGGFSKAARAVDISQPALSLGLQRLERKLGVELVDRSASSFELTQAGLDLYQICTQIEESLEAFLRKEKPNHASRPRSLRIGTAFAIGITPLKKLLRTQAVLDGDIEVQIIMKNGFSLVTDLVNDSLDVAFVPDNVYDHRLGFAQLVRDRLIFVGSRKYVKAFSNRSWTESCREVPLLTYPGESPIRSVVDRLFRKYSVGFKTMIAVESIDAIKELLLAETGCAFVLGSLFEKEIASGSLCEIKPPISLPQSGIVIAYRKTQTGKTSAKFIRDLFSNKD